MTVTTLGDIHWQQIETDLCHIDLSNVKDASGLLNVEFDIGIMYVCPLRLARTLRLTRAGVKPKQTESASAISAEAISLGLFKYLAYGGSQPVEILMAILAARVSRMIKEM